MATAGEDTQAGPVDEGIPVIAMLKILDVLGLATGVLGLSLEIERGSHNCSSS